MFSALTAVGETPLRRENSIGEKHLVDLVSKFDGKLFEEQTCCGLLIHVG